MNRAPRTTPRTTGRGVTVLFVGEIVTLTFGRWQGERSQEEGALGPERGSHQEMAGSPKSTLIARSAVMVWGSRTIRAQGYQIASTRNRLLIAIPLQRRGQLV